MIADGVVIGANAKLRKFERVSKKREARPQTAGDGSDGDDEEDSDSELEEVEARTSISAARFTTVTLTVYFTDQEGAAQIVGKDSNALVWPPPSPDDEEELDERESYHNQRLMRIGTLSMFCISVTDS